MKIYTKSGDQGRTGLLNNSRVSKADDRIELVGIIDELNANLGLVKVIASNDFKEEISEIQRILMRVMSGAISYMGQFKLAETDITALEEKIDKMEDSMSRPKDFVLYGKCELSARLDVARAVARKAERQLCRVSNYHRTDPLALKYLNRLADYLYVCARMSDCNC